VKPVFRTVWDQQRVPSKGVASHAHIFLSSSAFLVLTARGLGLFSSDEAKAGGVVPFGGPLIRLLSVITHSLKERLLAIPVSHELGTRRGSDRAVLQTSLRFVGCLFQPRSSAEGEASDQLKFREILPLARHLAFKQHHSFTTA
jgi:hypothetical protein